jgi:phosphatidylglycerol lysyltransferase
MRAAIERATRTWLATRRLAPLSFLVRIDPFDFAEQRDCFVAERCGELVGFAGVVPVPARGGWFLEDLVRAPGAPNGTTELLVDAAMRRAMDLGSSWMTLGLAPLAGDVATPLRFARRSTRALYDFDGLRRFKAKFRPAQWMPIYLAYPPEQSALLSLADGLSAFTPHGLVDFGLRSLWQTIAR